MIPGARAVITRGSRVEVMASAVQALGERCVLSVPPGDNLRVARMPRGLGP